MQALLFPGQGSQAVGMGQDFFENFATAREVFEEVDDALQQKLTHLIFKGSLEDLSLTENTQPALMAVSMAILRTLMAAQGKPLRDAVSFMAGHSLGEYTALCAAEALSLGDAACLLQFRGQAMQQAVPVGEGAMAALLGLDLSVVEDIVNEAAAGEICVVANDNCPGQIVISGTAAAVARATALAKERGAKRVVELSVSVPSHSPLMQPAAVAMQRALAAITINPAAIPVVTNVTAMPVSHPLNVQEFLIAQLTQRVRWRESIENLVKLGVTTFVEIGAGKVLAGLVKRIAPEARIFTLNTPHDMEDFLKQG
jgi:[acyl-carrier-protein] S-malonyltransferase